MGFLSGRKIGPVGKSRAQAYPNDIACIRSRRGAMCELGGI
ncbi:hypothetical protein A8H35_02590 [Burkholderia thailandensis]|nr:hypothetical protein A8H35_02590 [Burkholderia thailandensis]AWY68343.1 hypothetical protein A8H36_25780 [Burkholderia thailandensis]PHH35944.1 hypothetical protein CRX59_03815 [Burkholderia thailandensis]